MKNKDKRVNVEDLLKREDPGVDVAKLKEGTRLLVKTKNSTYAFMVTSVPKQLYAKGGLKIPKIAKVYLSGSTWGGSCLKIGWIGINMHMEIYLEKDQVLRTTAVESVKVVGPNKAWFYELPS